MDEVDTLKAALAEHARISDERHDALSAEKRANDELRAALARAEEQARWYDEAQRAANECGFGPGSAAEAIRYLAAEAHDRGEALKGVALGEITSGPEAGTWCWCEPQDSSAPHTPKCLKARAAFGWPSPTRSTPPH